jgi:hypothetical protein
LVGDVVSNIGILLVGIAMTRGVRGVPRWLGVLGIVAAVLIALGLVATTLAPDAVALGAARPAGFQLFMVWLVATGVVMWRWRPAE